MKNESSDAAKLHRQLLALQSNSTKVPDLYSKHEVVLLEVDRADLVSIA